MRVEEKKSGCIIGVGREGGVLDAIVHIAGGGGDLIMSYGDVGLERRHHKFRTP